MSIFDQSIRWYPLVSACKIGPLRIPADTQRTPCGYQRIGSVFLLFSLRIMSAGSFNLSAGGYLTQRTPYPRHNVTCG